MPRLIGRTMAANGICESWWDLGDGRVAVERSHDAQDAVDLVAAVNAEGAQSIDGLGKPLGEIDQVLLMDWAEKRGIPWDKLLYTNEYDAELKRFLAEHKRLAYENRKTVHAVQ